MNSEFEGGAALTESTVQTADIAKYSTYITLTLLIYDILVNLDAEVDLVWSRKWTSGKLLAILNRYLGAVLLFLKAFLFSTYDSNAMLGFPKFFISKLTQIPRCSSWSTFIGILTLIGLLPAQIILQMRLYAVFNKSLWVLGLTVTCCAAQLIGTIGTAVTFYPIIRTLAKFGPGCYNFYVPPRYFLVFVPTLLYETLLCILMIFATWRTFVSSTRLPLLNILIRDSALYFFSISLITLYACILYAVEPEMGWITAGWQICVPSVMAHRLLLNMRAHFFASQHVIDGTLRLTENINNVSSGPVGSLSHRQ